MIVSFAVRVDRASGQRTLSLNHAGSLRALTDQRLWSLALISGRKSLAARLFAEILAGLCVEPFQTSADILK